MVPSSCRGRTAAVSGPISDWKRPAAAAQHKAQRLTAVGTRTSIVRSQRCLYVPGFDCCWQWRTHYVSPASGCLAGTKLKSAVLARAVVLHPPALNAVHAGRSVWRPPPNSVQAKFRDPRHRHLTHHTLAPTPRRCRRRSPSPTTRRRTSRSGRSRSSSSVLKPPAEMAHP